MTLRALLLALAVAVASAGPPPAPCNPALPVLAIELAGPQPIVWIWHPPGRDLSVEYSLDARTWHQDRIYWRHWETTNSWIEYWPPTNQPALFYRTRAD